MTLTVLITGASRGIGFDAARRIAATGATVFAGVRSPDRFAATLRSLSSPGDLRPLQLDVTDDDSVAAAVDAVQAAAGSLDVLINNAGVGGTFAPAEEVGPADFTEVLATNVLGPVRVTRAFLPLLRRGTMPRLVMVSSGMGSLTLQGNDDEYAEIAHVPYPASKAALNMITVQYPQSLPDILVTAVDPGLTATEFTGHRGHSVHEGSEALVSAALRATGPSGCFVDRHGVTPW